MTENIFKYQHQGFEVGSAVELDAEALSKIVAIVGLKPSGTLAVLQGRGLVGRGEITGVGAVVCKKYRRGGLLGRLLANYHLRLGQTRSSGEFKMLNEVRALGVNSPEPVAYINRGKFLYESWLIMREIPGENSLANLVDEDEDRLSEILSAVVRQIKLLIENRICHIDLHPGNALVAADGSVYLIDFDKSIHWTRSLEELRDRYLNRWRRAVIKHGLREELVEQLSLGLLQNHAAYGKRS